MNNGAFEPRFYVVSKAVVKTSYDNAHPRKLTVLYIEGSADSSIDTVAWCLVVSCRQSFFGTLARVDNRSWPKGAAPHTRSHVLYGANLSFRRHL